MHATAIVTEAMHCLEVHDGGTACTKTTLVLVGASVRVAGVLQSDPCDGRPS